MSSFIPKEAGMKAEPSEKLSARIYRQIYMTDHAKERIKHIPSLLAQMRLNIEVFAQMCEITAADIGAFMIGTKTPTLWEYLKMASVLEWDLSHDVNRLYMFETAVHKTLAEKVARVTEFVLLNVKASPYEVEQMNAYYRMASKPDNYSCADWSEMALWVMRKEHEYGLKNPIELED